MIELLKQYGMIALAILPFAIPVVIIMLIVKAIRGD